LLYKWKELKHVEDFWEGWWKDRERKEGRGGVGWGGVLKLKRAFVGE
jgi:hypothetical protein